MPGDVRRQLDRVLDGHFTLSLPLALDSDHRYVIFSDQHKGGGDLADEFVGCKTAYHAALDHYRRCGFTLILLGDVEELWEQSFPSVVRAHGDSLRLEGSFPAGRYFRIWGNHDDEWMDERAVRRSLKDFMPTSAVYEAIRFEVVRDGEAIGTILLAHGHQGTFGSDKFKRFSRAVLRGYRHFQRFTGIGQTTPSKNACLRGQHDRTLYEWASTKRRLILIAGHTHRTVWSSQTFLQRLEKDREFMLGQPEADQRTADLARLDDEIKYRTIEHPPCNDTLKSKPCYFNTGCCKYKTGNITGIEIEFGRLRLVRWRSRQPEREVLETADIGSVLAEL